MDLDAGRRDVFSLTVFWLCSGLGVSALALGWYLVHAPLEQETHKYLLELHVSLGLTAAALILVQFIVSMASYAFGGTKGDRRFTVGFGLRQIVYLSLLTAIVSGILGAVSRGEPISFWGQPIPFGDIADLTAGYDFQRVHQLAAYVLAGAIVAYLAYATARFVSRPAPISAPILEPAPIPTPPSVAFVIAEGLAYNFRFFGRIVFWLQLLLGVIAAPLLAFGFMGRTVSPGHTTFADAIYWASAGLVLLFISVVFGFNYIKIGQRLPARPDQYLGRQRRGTVWLLDLSGFVSVVGALISFVGVGLSVMLLIGKTVSQPPGIAITDPNKIVRALDIFVLLVNFDLLFAHFAGVAMAAWLSISALKARHQYLVASEAVR